MLRVTNPVLAPRDATRSRGSTRGRWVGVTILSAHGLLHVFGVMLLWKVAEPGRLRYEDVAPAPGTAAGYVVGAMWLLAALLFWFAALALARRRERWWVITLGAVAVSMAVMALDLGRATAGLAIDGLIAVAVLLVAPIDLGRSIRRGADTHAS
jgi:hypothetical protein